MQIKFQHPQYFGIQNKGITIKVDNIEYDLLKNNWHEIDTNDAKFITVESWLYSQIVPVSNTINVKVNSILLKLFIPVGVGLFAQFLLFIIKYDISFILRHLLRTPLYVFCIYYAYILIKKQYFEIETK